MSDVFTIKTVFFDHLGREIKTNRSKNPNSACMLAFNNLQMNVYGATSTQVYDESTGEEHASMIRHIDGRIEVTYTRDPRRYMDPIRRSFHALIS